MKTELQPKLNWEIREEAVTINNSFDTGKKAIIRNDNGQLLGIVGKHYQPVTNSQLMHFTNALTKSGEFVLEGFDELNEGKIVLAFLKNTNPNLRINHCENEEYMFVGNSFDGTKRFHIGTATRLIRCANQFSATLKVFSKKHTSLIDMDNYVIQNIIRTYKAKKDVLYETFDGMETVRVDENVVNRLVKEIFMMLSTDSSAIKQKDWTKSPSMMTMHKCIEREMKDLGNNAFGLFNGITWYTSHEMRNAGTDFGITGTANQINQKAFRFCNNLKRISNQTI